MFCDNEKFCGNPRCVLHVSANDENVVGHGEWATLSNGTKFARVKVGEVSYCHVCAVDPSLRRAAIGARIAVTAAGTRRIRTLSRGFSYMSSSEAVAHFGLGDVAAVESIEVFWPDGSREQFPGSEADQRLELLRGSGRALP